MKIKKILSAILIGTIFTSSILGCRKYNIEDDIEDIQNDIENANQENNNQKIKKEKDGVLSLSEIMEDMNNNDFNYLRDLDLNNKKYFNGDIIIHGYVQNLNGKLVTLTSYPNGDGEFYCYDVIYGNDLKKGDKIYIRGYLSDEEGNALIKAKIIEDKDIDKEIKLLKAKRKELKEMRNTQYDVISLMNELKSDREAFWEKYYGAVITITGIKGDTGITKSIFLISSENEDLNNFNQGNNTYISFSSSEDIENANAIEKGKTIKAIGRLLPRTEDDEETIFDILNAQLIN